jgi:hypothetical protein
MHPSVCAGISSSATLLRQQFRRQRELHAAFLTKVRQKGSMLRPAKL